MFNIIFTTGKFPSEWSVSLISPVHKKGSLYDISNFRGISLTPCISKLFETVLNNRLLNWCVEKKGFIKGNRTSDAHIILNNLIDRNIYSCFVDFEKAFDKVPPSILFSKLAKYGITSKFFNVILSMYSDNKTGSSVYHAFLGIVRLERMLSHLWKISSSRSKTSRSFRN